MTYYLIGDAHLGKTFKSKDIPLEMKGKREELLYEKFRKLIKDGIYSYLEGSTRGIVQLGDLFDSPTVDYNTLMFAYRFLWGVECANVPCVILAGNHDLYKDTSKVSAIKVLAEMFKGSEFIRFVIDNPLVYDNNLFVPYNHFVDIQEQLSTYVDKGYNVYGHFNEEDFSWLKQNFNYVYTGHIHSPRVEEKLEVIGSIMPLTFGEDPDNSFMKTCTLAEYERDVAEGVSESKCYRIKLKEGEELPLEKKCLQMSVFKNNSEKIEEISVDFEEFNVEQLMKEALPDSDLFEEVYNLYSQLRMEEAGNV